MPKVRGLSERPGAGRGELSPGQRLGCQRPRGAGGFGRGLRAFYGDQLPGAKPAKGGLLPKVGPARLILRSTAPRYRDSLSRLRKAVGQGASSLCLKATIFLTIGKDFPTLVLSNRALHLYFIWEESCLPVPRSSSAGITNLFL